MALAVLLFVTISFSLPSGLEVAKATEPTFADPNLRDKNAAGGYADVSSVKIAVPATEEDGEKKTREWLEKCGLQAETITSADADISAFSSIVTDSAPVISFNSGAATLFSHSMISVPAGTGRNIVSHSPTVLFIISTYLLLAALIRLWNSRMKMTNSRMAAATA